MRMRRGAGVCRSKSWRGRHIREGVALGLHCRRRKNWLIELLLLSWIAKIRLLTRHCHRSHHSRSHHHHRGWCAHGPLRRRSIHQPCGHRECRSGCLWARTQALATTAVVATAMVMLVVMTLRTPSIRWGYDTSRCRVERRMRLLQLVGILR